MTSVITTTLTARQLRGIQTRTNNAAEMAGVGRIAQLWAQFMQSQPGATEILAIYHNYASDVNGDYDLTLVNQAQSDTGPASLELEAGDYLRFDRSDAQPTTVIALWQEIWAYFANHREIQRAYRSDLEHYHANGVSIYIGILTRQGN